MSFGNVSKHFENLKKRFTLPDEQVRRVCSDVIEKELGVTIDIKKIRVANSVLVINIQPSLKNEIFMNKHKILELIKEVCKEKTPKDIR